MKKITYFITIIIAMMYFSVIVFGSSNWINLDLKYNDKIHKYSAEKVNIMLDGKYLTNLDMEAIILNGRTLVPLRAIFEEVGADVEWDNIKKEVFIKAKTGTISFKINSDEIIKNNKEIIKIDVPAKIINDHTMIPIRAISTAIGYNVTWENATRTVIIKTTINNTEQTTVQTVSKQQKQDGIKILWDQTYQSHNDRPEKREHIDGLDVLSPTWFEIINDEGDVNDKGSLEYAKWAKKQGYQLWGLITNGFDPVITNNVLSSPQKREKVITKMLEYSKKYNLDGINIDFENVAKKDGDIYLQFIKEATPIFKANGLIVSVDMYVPTPWTAHYNMKEVAKIVDYVIIMAYDEHYRTSVVSGSTSSLPWSEKYLKESLKLVPKEKLILGVPFYTRLWSEEIQKDGSIKVIDSVALTMEETQTLIKKTGATVVWLEDKKQHYIEYTEDGIIKKVWIEDAKSIEERMKLSREYDIKGVAFWKRGFEDEKIWDIINKYYK